MTVTDPNRTEVRGRADTVRTRVMRETKPSPKTTELWLTVAAVAALVVVYNASRDLSLDLFRASLLCTVIVAAYVVSRGLAKAGSHDDDRAAAELDQRR
ncbi:MAG: hypothetical protein QOG65_1721 [Actinomycetota bacterium]|jgi:hypothetical protein|nr:hypothetical protein [Actinomycetota bacterium]